MTRKIYEIAKTVRADWKPVSPYAAPYLDAMDTLDNINEMFIADTARSVVLYFLANAQGWRGEIARNTKKELNALLKG